MRMYFYHKIQKIKYLHTTHIDSNKYFIVPIFPCSQAAQKPVEKKAMN